MKTRRLTIFLLAFLLPAAIYFYFFHWKKPEKLPPPPHFHPVGYAGNDSVYYSIYEHGRLPDSLQTWCRGKSLLVNFVDSLFKEDSLWIVLSEIQKEFLIKDLKLLTIYSDTLNETFVRSVKQKFHPVVNKWKWLSLHHAQFLEWKSIFKLNAAQEINPIVLIDVSGHVRGYYNPGKSKDLQLLMHDIYLVLVYKE